MRNSTATIADVAREANVSTATVSRMINGIGPISKDTEVRVRAAIRKLNYQPRRKRRSRAGSGEGGSSGLTKAPIAFLRIVPGETQDRHPVTDSLVEALHRNAHALGHPFSVHEVSDLDRREAREVVGNAKGVLVRTANDPDLVHNIHKWLGDLPAVQVLGVNLMNRLYMDLVTPDNIQAGVLAAEYLIRRGCSQLVFAATGVHCGVGLERCLSFVRTAHRAGKPVRVFIQSDKAGEKELHRELGGIPVECKVTKSRLELSHLITSNQKEPFGLFVPTDLELAMLLPQLQMMGVDFESSSHAIGCDNEIRCLSGLFPAPATMDLHLENIAMRALRRIVFRMGHPQESFVRIYVSPTIILPGDLSAETETGKPISAFQCAETESETEV